MQATYIQFGPYMTNYIKQTSKTETKCQFKLFGEIIEKVIPYLRTLKCIFTTFNRQC